MSKSDMTETDFATLYDSLLPSSPSKFRWATLSTSEQHAARVLFAHARNVGYDEGHRDGEQDGYKAAEAAQREDMQAQRKAIEKLAESFQNASGAPYITGADEHVLKWMSEKLKELIK